MRSMMMIALVAALAVTSARATDLAEVELYMESECPSCKQFITGTLAEIMENGIGDLIHLTIVPWGNAGNVTKDPNTDEYSWTCQHGPTECRMNLIETCVITNYDNQEQFFPFVKCVEAAEDMFVQAPTCAEMAGMDWDKIMACVDGTSLDTDGSKAQLEAYKATKDLEPAHEFVPWVVLNEEPLGTAFDTLPELICEFAAIKTKAPLPAACSKYIKTTGVMSQIATIRDYVLSYIAPDVEVCKKEQ